MQLTLPLLKSIRRLLRAGVRYTEIARRFDLAVGTIARIASERKLRRRKLHLLTDADLPEDDQPPDYLAANLRRCPGCGGMVYHWPCLACRLFGAAAGRRDRETERRRDRETEGQRDGGTERQRDGATERQRDRALNP